MESQRREIETKRSKHVWSLKSEEHNFQNLLA